VIAPDRLDFLSGHTTPDRLAALLNRLGWHQYGGQAGQYSRWVAPDESKLIVPLNPATGDYRELLQQALYRLASVVPREDILFRALNADLRQDDEIKFSKDVATIAGAVSWPVGKGIVTAAEEALLAAAKTRLSRRAYYGSANGRFAHRFLEACMMGQTEIGSYVVTAFAPANESFPERETLPGRPALPEIASYSGRDISRALSDSLGATREAVAHYKSSSSLAGFEESVPKGVNREMAVAVRKLVASSDGAQVSIQWSSAVPLSPDMPPQVSTFEFDGSDGPVLDQAITRLATMTPVEYVRVVGWVSVVARPKRGARGLIRLKVVAGSSAGTLRIPLTQEQFEIASQAIAQERGLMISGRQEKESGTTYLYDAEGIEMVDLAPRDPAIDSSPIPGQAEIEM
jgi:hypothetical protein